VRHPEVGRLVFEHAVFHPAQAADQRLILYSPRPEEDTPAKLARLMEQHGADGDPDPAAASAAVGG
jgi:hypothetical protein